jgi:hypothetical protein
MDDKRTVSRETNAWFMLAASLTTLLAVLILLLAYSTQPATAHTTDHNTSTLSGERSSAPSVAQPVGVDPCGPNSNYTYTITYGVGTPEPVTNLVPGSQCDECTTVAALPFPVALYDGIYSTVILGSNGTMGFVSNTNPPNNLCTLHPDMNTAILPFHTNLTTDVSVCGPDCGWYMQTRSVGGEQVVDFKIQAMQVYSPGIGSPVIWTYRVHQSYDPVDEVGASTVLTHSGGAFFLRNVNSAGILGGATIGVQKDLASGLYTHVVCSTGTISASVLITFSQIPCGTATPTPPSGTRTATRTTQPRTPTVSTPAPTATACTIEFSDVPPGTTFYDFVRCLACKGIISGYSDGTYLPGNNMTRGQMSKVVSNAAEFTEPHSEQSFQDVPVGSTFHLFVERLFSRGHISGYACGGAGEPCVGPTNRPYFRPGNPVTRGQTAKIVASAAGLPAPPPGLWTFQDVPQGSPFWQWIEPLSSNGAISGYPCGGEGEPCVAPENRYYFRPGNNVTRGQSAKIVASTFFLGCNPR